VGAGIVSKKVSADPLFSRMIVRRVLFGFAVFEVGNRFGWDAVILAGPFAEIDCLTSFRTERTRWVIFPGDASTACWTFHKASEERKARPICLNAIERRLTNSLNQA
jgi:hypothetical protein